MTTKIYVLIDPNNNQVRYVGKSNNPTKRYYKHCKFTNVKTHKNNWINKLLTEGKKPILCVIDEVSINEWVFWEMYWISQMKAWGFNLTNSTIGGDGSTTGNKTSFKKGRTAHNKGIPLTDEQKENLRLKNIGKKQSVFTKNKRSEALKGREINHLDKLLTSGEKTRFKKGGDAWNKGKTGYKLGGLRKAKPVLQIDVNDKVVNEFESCKDAALFIGKSRETIRKCCEGKTDKVAGFKWVYKTKQND
jgi:group I intron endonuclease